VARQIQVACRERGFFYVTGHGVPAGLLGELADDDPRVLRGDVLG
jgi:isopenicillin N synthase-like dioxygenase